MHQKIIDLSIFDMCLRDNQRYKMRFRLYEFELLKSNVEYVGHNIIQYENTKNKLNIINKWRFNETRKSLQSCFVLFNLYLVYDTHFYI